MSPKSFSSWLVAIAVAALAACGGGSSNDAGSGAFNGPAATTGRLSISLTDSPACGYDEAWVTVEKVRVHRSASAGDGDAGWIDIPLPAGQPLRVDLLTLTNGTLVPLGQVELPAGAYTQMRLVLAPNTAGNPLANAIKPTGGVLTPLTTPSAQQSGLKMNVDLAVPAGQVLDVAIDFDACKSFVKAGNSGKILLKPVLSVIPILSPAGQRVQGWLHPSLAAAGATVSVQSGGVVVRATPPLLDGTGRFVLYPVPVGSYELVVAANGFATAVVTGVPAHAGVATTINNVALPILPPASTAQAVSGTVSVGSGPNSTVDTGGVVHALQLLTGGPTIEVASANARSDDGVYTMALPLGAPVRAPYAAGATGPFAPDAAVTGRYRLAATVAAGTEVRFEDLVLGPAPLPTPVTQDFHFVLP